MAIRSMICSNELSQLMETCIHLFKQSKHFTLKHKSCTLYSFANKYFSLSYRDLALGSLVSKLI